MLERRVGVLAGALTAAEAERARADEERKLAHGHLVEVLAALVADAGVDHSELHDSASAILAAARSIAADHEALNTESHTIERLSEGVRERVHTAQAALGARVDLTRELADGGWWVLHTLVGGIRRGASALAAALARELDEGRIELAAEEEKLFEQTLAGSVRRALAERIRQANALVDGINVQLANVVTQAGGVQVRLRWEVDPEQLATVKSARALLLATRPTSPTPSGKHCRLSCGLGSTRRVRSWRPTLRGRRDCARRSTTGPGTASPFSSPTATGRASNRPRPGDSISCRPASARSPSTCR